MQCLIIVTSLDLQKINDLLADGWRVVHEPPPQLVFIPPREHPREPLTPSTYGAKYEPPPPLYYLLVVLEKPKLADP